MSKMTATQESVLNCIKDFISENGYPPTRSEISGLMGYKSPNSSQDHVRALEKKGFITIIKGISRGITIAEESSEAA